MCPFSSRVDLGQWQLLSQGSGLVIGRLDPRGNLVPRSTWFKSLRNPGIYLIQRLTWPWDPFYPGVDLALESTEYKGWTNPGIYLIQGLIYSSGPLGLELDLTSGSTLLLIANSIDPKWLLIISSKVHLATKTIAIWKPCHPGFHVTFWKEGVYVYWLSIIQGASKLLRTLLSLYSFIVL